MEMWDIECQVVEERSVLDHCPIWVKGMVKDWGPKPFKLFKRWFNHEGFRPFLEEACQSMQINGKPGFILKETLRTLKVKIRIWSKEVFGVLDLEVNNAINEFNALDATMDNMEGVLDAGGAIVRQVASVRT